MWIMGACQEPKVHRDTTVMSQSAFMDLWQTYTHCRTSEDTEAIVMDALKLNQAAQPEQPELPRLLKPVKPFVSTLPSRLAVDPKSMAASCSLHAGQAATAIGWNDLALQLYDSVLRHAPNSNESYYVRQAQEGLAEIERRRSSSPKLQPMSSSRSLLLTP
ncbi:MAG TPA: hypothetical protein VJ692_05850 [Nitrospiraceae bacterium]|nr:hypothetical protein [Nitrospiraceae bacterium]